MRSDSPIVAALSGKTVPTDVKTDEGDRRSALVGEIAGATGEDRARLPPVQGA